MSRLRVRVWFGEHPIADYWADQAPAVRYAAAVQRRFKGLRVTCEPITDGQPGEPLPPERWWEMVPR